MGWLHNTIEVEANHVRKKRTQKIKKTKNEWDCILVDTFKSVPTFLIIESRLSWELRVWNIWSIVHLAAFHRYWLESIWIKSKSIWIIFSSPKCLENKNNDDKNINQGKAKLVHFHYLKEYSTHLIKKIKQLLQCHHLLFHPKICSWLLLILQ